MQAALVKVARPPVSDTTPLPLPTPPATDFVARWLVPATLTALAYFMAGRLALLLAIPPGYAAPIYPSAGLALAAVLVYGRGAVLGTVVGAFAVNAMLDSSRAVDSSMALLLPLVSGLAAGLQAAIGAALVRWRLPGPLVLGEPREVAAFFLLGAMLACLVSSSVSTLALSWAGVLPPGSRAFTWWTWWVGDALGVLIGTPMVLTLIGRPRTDWAPRRITLALPLLATTALLALATVLVARWDAERSRSVFERDASAAAAQLEAELKQALFALEAVHGLYIGSDDVSPTELRRVTQPWLGLQINIQAIGYSPRVARSDIAKVQADVSASQGRPYAIFDRSPIAENDSHVLAIRLIEPLASNAGALGVNALSIPAARTALLSAIADDTPVATSGFVITQEPGKQTGVVIYRALYRGEPDSARRREALTGVVFVTLRMQQSVAAAMARAQPYLGWCLVDTDPRAERRRLAGPEGCESAPARAMQLKRPIELA
ncbi:MAG: histidine kinase, partial [Burkholderiales bacterium PBB5]